MCMIIPESEVFSLEIRDQINTLASCGNVIVNLNGVRGKLEPEPSDASAPRSFHHDAANDHDSRIQAHHDHDPFTNYSGLAALRLANLNQKSNDTDHDTSLSNLNQRDFSEKRAASVNGPRQWQG